MKKKSRNLMVLSLACMGLFTACTSNADTLPNATANPATTAPMVTSSPAATQSASPMPTVSAEPATVGAASTVADARRISDRVEDEVEKLSEVDEADAVVVGNIALIGISYDSTYQGGMTERITQMVTERAEMTDKAITTVHVTDNQTIRQSIAKLNDMLDDANASFEELQARVLEITGSLTGGDNTIMDNGAAQSKSSR